MFTVLLIKKYLYISNLVYITLIIDLIHYAIHLNHLNWKLGEYQVDD